MSAINRMSGDTRTASERREQAEGYAVDEALAEGEPTRERIPVSWIATDLFRESIVPDAQFTIFTHVRTKKVGIYTGTFEVVCELTGEVVASESKDYHRRQREGLHKTLLYEGKARIYESL